MFLFRKRDGSCIEKNKSKSDFGDQKHVTKADSRRMSETALKKVHNYMDIQQNKKTTSRILAAIVIVAVAGMAYSAYSSKNVTVVNTNRNGNSDAIDTSGWKTYRDEELGIEFEYPSTWGNIEKGYYEAPKSSNQYAGDPAGKKLSIGFTNNHFTQVYAASSDYHPTFKYPITVNKNCYPSEAVLTNDNSSICRTIKFAGMETSEFITSEAYECSFQNLREVNHPLQNKTYQIVGVIQRYNSQQSCVSEDEEKNPAVRASELKNLFEESDLTIETTEGIQGFHRIIDTFKLL